MKIVTGKDFDSKKDVLVLGVFENGVHALDSINHELFIELTGAATEKLFTGKVGELYTTGVHSLSYKKVVAVGLGKEKEITLERVRCALGKVVKQIKQLKCLSFTTNILSVCMQKGSFSAEELGRASGEALILADYQFKKYLPKERWQKNVSEVQIIFEEEMSDFNKALFVGKTIAESANSVKEIVNDSPSVVTPSYLEKVARRLAGKHSTLKLTVLNREEMEREGMGAILGVAKGSVQPPKMLILHYGGSKEKPVALIGKGITFDSGGYNLKPTGFMEDMKCDMAGGAAVLGIMDVAARLKIKKNLVGVVPCCENMVSGSAQRPGDIVRAYNGKTIEILNTDAEGRLILADALSYTEAKFKPAVIIDLATLTGACMVAFGYFASGILGNDQKLVSSLCDAGEASGDRLWPLPFYEEFASHMDGSITDLQNLSNYAGGKTAGAITAGVFLSKFVAQAKWAHIDIAGPAFLVKDEAYSQKGATGAGVRALVYYLLYGDAK